MKNEIHEVAIVYKRPLLNSMILINSSNDIDTFLRETVDMGRIDLSEFFGIILLNNSNRILGYSEIGKGDSTGVIVNVLEIFQLVIKTNSKCLVLYHNHPSGKLSASQSDKNLTARVKEACQLFSINLLDHIIITSESYYSFADDGIL